MKSYVQDFTSHLKQAIEIGNGFSPKKVEISNVVISGLGGSGIGGTIVSQLLANQLKVPIVVNKDYSIPEFVGKNTLFIASSYSGNTEETLEALEKAEAKGAEIAIVTSGGKAAEIADNKNYSKIQIPGGYPPRAAFGISFPQLLFILNGYGLIDNQFITDITKGIALLKSNEGAITIEAKELAGNLLNKMPIIYSDASFEGVAVRFRQQINENAKVLCWHHAVPEMNHNELVGWTEKNDNLVVVFFKNDSDYYRTAKRMEINKDIISNYTSSIYEVTSKGDSMLEKMLYLINFGDWVSVYLADLRQVDSIEVNVISGLKSALAKL